MNLKKAKQLRKQMNYKHELKPNSALTVEMVEKIVYVQHPKTKEFVAQTIKKPKATNPVQNQYRKAKEEHKRWARKPAKPSFA